MVLMIACAFDFDVLAVEEKAFVRIEVNGANAERRFAAIRERGDGGFAESFDDGDEAIHVRSFKGPKRGIADVKLLGEIVNGPGRDSRGG